jgi:hypothetical protein
MLLQLEKQAKTYEQLPCLILPPPPTTTTTKRTCPMSQVFVKEERVQVYFFIVIYIKAKGCSVLLYKGS